MDTTEFDDINCKIDKLFDRVMLIDESDTKAPLETKVEYLVSAFYSQGQLLDGVKDGPHYLSNFVSKAFGSKKHILVEPTYDSTNLFEPWQHDYEKLYNVLKTIPMYVLVGGDHSVGMSSVAASIYKTFDVNNLYVIWIGAHVDLNTMCSSITKNINGQSLAGIIGYEKPWFPIKKTLPTTNLLYFGIRDMDEFEKEKIIEDNIFLTDNLNKMLEKLELIIEINPNAIFHISFDVGALDSEIMTSTGCAIGDGLFPTDISCVYNYVKDKLTAFDLVEYNPHIGNTEMSYDSIKTIIENITRQDKN